MKVIQKVSVTETYATKQMQTVNAWVSLFFEPRGKNEWLDGHFCKTSGLRSCVCDG